jgi:hypothetical protein
MFSSAAAQRNARVSHRQSCKLLHRVWFAYDLHKGSVWSVPMNETPTQLQDAAAIMLGKHFDGLGMLWNGNVS